MVGALAGCSALWGVQDPILDDDAGVADATSENTGQPADAGRDAEGGVVDAAADATNADGPADALANVDGSDSGGDTGLDAGQLEAAAEAGPEAGCGSVVDVSAAVLVYAANGSDVSTCGTLASPCQTIKYGIAQAVSATPAKAYVYVVGSPGTELEFAL